MNPVDQFSLDVGYFILLSGMEDWKDLFVPVPVLRALKENGFVEPTPIQAQVLPPAIRDRLDILGAAETVILDMLNILLSFRWEGKAW